MLHTYNQECIEIAYAFNFKEKHLSSEYTARLTCFLPTLSETGHPGVEVVSASFAPIELFTRTRIAVVVPSSEVAFASGFRLRTDVHWRS